MFDSLEEYFRYTNILSFSQQELIFSYLLPSFKKKVIEGMRKTNRLEFHYKREMDKSLRQIKDDLGYDLLKIKSEIINGKSRYIPKEDWNAINERLFRIPWKIKYSIIGGIVAEVENDNAIFLTRKR